MSPAADPGASSSSARNAAHPYPGGPSQRSNGPKSSRQQYTACAACRMRRVKCDLKVAASIAESRGEPPERARCTNCADRALKCVDEFAERKKKSLRRGRRLIQVEQRFGPQSIDYTRSTSPGPVAGPSTTIPRLHPDFFNSPFYRRFHIQRPIVDPTEFSARFQQSLQGKPEALGPLGELICMVFVTWAASYGVDEAGVEEPHNGMEYIKQRRETCNKMVLEVLRLIDYHGILRRPTWDGVRILLLIMPLTEDVQMPMERLAMYQAAIAQIYSLSRIESTVKSGQGDFVDALVRARIFWYGHVHEGITNGLHGRKLIFDDDDLDIFHNTLPPSLTPPTQAVARSAFTQSFTYRYATAPIRVSSACRLINSALTGPKAQMREFINEPKLREAWEALEKCWEEFDGLLQLPQGGIVPEDSERFVNGWKVFIFECQNVIRDKLKERLEKQQAHHRSAFLDDPESEPERRISRINDTIRLHAIAEDKCHKLSKVVISIIRQHLGTSFFQYDASLVRDGTSYAGTYAAYDTESEENFKACLQALGEMRWGFSNSEARAEAVRWARNNRRSERERQRMLEQSRTPAPSPPPLPSLVPLHSGQDDNMRRDLPPLPLFQNDLSPDDTHFPSSLTEHSGSYDGSPRNSPLSSGSPSDSGRNQPSPGLLSEPIRLPPTLSMQSPHPGCSLPPPEIYFQPAGHGGPYFPPAPTTYGPYHGQSIGSHPPNSFSEHHAAFGFPPVPASLDYWRHGSNQY
ncbi:hypothetical protein BOTBODRAFT_54128 [Botryobasidium botryosum FD-172 SS1]|uniref:Zn(2)-C6 fungal-type domain-containing protein n=1 Tax=Botryobasidium botryosum (strain FD-172 SS1) TaxID=930990 RepID=A0A067MKS9_BOTB1|nr:hypothetical protein BOTBODRAFT_54128 [Botryobasidium botryosum FD-172 SS1]